MILRLSTPSKSAAPRLVLQALEDRAVPAAAVFHGGVLTVTANAGETVTVTPTGTTAGSFTVSDGSPNLVFNSAAAGAATSLVTNFHTAGQGTLSVGDGLKLDGYFTVRGGAAATTVTLAGAVTVGKGFNFLGTGAGNDTVITGTGFRVGGAATFKMGGGTQRPDTRRGEHQRGRRRPRRGGGRHGQRQFGRPAGGDRRQLADRGRRP